MGSQVSRLLWRDFPIYHSLSDEAYAHLSKKENVVHKNCPQISPSVHLQKALVPDPVLKPQVVEHSPALPGAPLYSLCSLRSLVSTIGFSSGSGEQGAYPSMVGLLERDGAGEGASSGGLQKGGHRQCDGVHNFGA